jgi:CRISPR/Cas system CMR subunit Cmr4 (Cas7 group RAMP superfamily)
MTMFINSMLWCLIIAAGIGGVVGWLLRNVSAGKLARQLTDVAAMMHLKEQMLEKARHELRETDSKLQANESSMITLQDMKLQLAERDHCIRELEQLHQELKKQAEENEAFKAAYTQAVVQQIDKAA